MDCKHGIDERFCSLCNGMQQRWNELKQEKVRCDKETKKLKEEYETMKETYSNFNELWTVDEIECVYEAFSDTSIRNKRFRKKLYQVAMDLQRTVNAVRWQYKHLFVKKAYHRSSETMTFLKQHNLDFYNDIKSLDK